MPKCLFILVGLFTCMLFSACHTSSRATKCPTFSQKTSRQYVSSNAKQTKKLEKLKPYLSEKYALKRAERALEKEKNDFKISNQFNKIELKREVLIASTAPIFKIENRPLNFRKPNWVQPTKDDKKAILPKSQFSVKQQEKFEKRIKKLKKKVKKKVYQTNSKEDKKAKIGGILGIISLPLLFIPYLNYLVLPVIITALVLTGKPSRRQSGPNSKIAKIGFIMSIISLALFVIFFVYLLIFLANLTLTFF